MATFSSTNSKNLLVINVQGSFTFEDRKKFRACYEDITCQDSTRVIINLTNTNFLDSSSFEMLLMLRESFGGENADITLEVQDNHDVRKLIEVVHFHDLFKID